jgi:hypothetical protein
LIYVAYSVRDQSERGSRDRIDPAQGVCTGKPKLTARQELKPCRTDTVSCPTSPGNPVRFDDVLDLTETKVNLFVDRAAGLVNNRVQYYPEATRYCIHVED